MPEMSKMNLKWLKFTNDFRKPLLASKWTYFRSSPELAILEKNLLFLVKNTPFTL